MEIEVTLYGGMSAAAGSRRCRVQVDGDPPRVSDLREALARSFPLLAPHLGKAAVGIGVELAADDVLLEPGAEISLLPPVSGGEGGVGGYLTTEPLSLEELLAETEGTDAGALVVFGGMVRYRDGDDQIAALDYDVHPQMAAHVLRTIEEDILAREGILACRIVHRTGVVASGEASVYVVVRGRHRPEAFEAAREAIERVKREAPIWKEDLHADGQRSPRPLDSGASLRP